MCAERLPEQTRINTSKFPTKISRNKYSRFVSLSHRLVIGHRLFCFSNKMNIHCFSVLILCGFYRFVKKITHTNLLQLLLLYFVFVFFFGSLNFAHAPLGCKKSYNRRTCFIPYTCMLDFLISGWRAITLAHTFDSAKCSWTEKHRAFKLHKIIKFFASLKLAVKTRNGKKEDGMRTMVNIHKHYVRR